MQKNRWQENRKENSWRTDDLSETLPATYREGHMAIGKANYKIKKPNNKQLI